MLPIHAIEIDNGGGAGEEGRSIALPPSLPPSPSEFPREAAGRVEKEGTGAAAAATTDKICDCGKGAAATMAAAGGEVGAYEVGRREGGRNGGTSSSSSEGKPSSARSRCRASAGRPSKIGEALSPAAAADGPSLLPPLVSSCVCCWCCCCWCCCCWCCCWCPSKSG